MAVDRKTLESTQLALDDVHFANDEITSHWYNGIWPLCWMRIETEELHAIHANAFTSPAFQKLEWLSIHAENSTVSIYDGAYNGLQLHVFAYRTTSVALFPAGLFDPLADSISLLRHEVWPNSINMDEMFANVPFRLLRILYIENVAEPQTKFRHLAASNFSAFNRLEFLFLMYCGIETIDARTFDGIGHTLRFINLGGNELMTISVDTFRRVFESKSQTMLSVYDNKEPMACTCSLIEMEVMQCPYESVHSQTCVDCLANKSFVADDCGVYRLADVEQMCIHKRTKEFMRVITFRQAYADDSFSIRTNFTSKIRVLLVNFDTTWSKKCADRASKTNYKCLNIDISVDRFRLDVVEEIRDAKLVSITVIPILYRFGARAVHAQTVRRASIFGEWLLDHWVSMAIISILLELVIGFGGGICVAHIKWQCISNNKEQCDAGATELSSTYESYDQIEPNAMTSPIDYDGYGLYDQTDPTALPNDYIIHECHGNMDTSQA